MSIFSLFGKNINEGLERANATEGSVILDVRTKNEYKQGHVPGSINIPLDQLAKKNIPSGPLFVYCLSGARSSQACNFLKSTGRKAENIGGLSSYKGRMER